MPIDPGLTPVPLGLGMIMSYARSYKDGLLDDHYYFLPNWVIDPDHIDKIDPAPSIFLFSNYIWSCAKNLNMSAQINAHSPDTALETALEVQHALMPAAGRTFLGSSVARVTAQDYN